MLKRLTTRPYALATYVGLGCLTAVFSIATLLWFLWDSSWLFFQQFGIQTLWLDAWYPYENLYGFLPAITGTVWALCIALLIAIPCGLAAAIVSSEVVSSTWQAWIRLSMEVLAGIPSVVYGLIGLWLLLPLLQSHLDLLTGHSLLAAGLILSLMILPTIMLMAQDALQGVAAEQREAAELLGLNWNQVLLRILLPQAWAGIRSGILLAIGRGLGETMAVMLVVGSLDRMPQPFYNILEPAQTLTSRIGREMGEAAFGSLHFSALMACGLILAILALAFSFSAQKMRPST